MQIGITKQMDYFERVRTIVGYIEANLHNDLTLDDLARQAFFCSYHFHRIFQTIMGDSVMEYIRKRRLAKAASDLRSSAKKIIEIALEFHFNSPETFTRAFKKYYGVTPEIYRRGPQPSIYFETKVTAKEAIPMYDWNFSQRIQCDDAAKQECMEVLNLIVSLAEKARSRGLLSLEADLELIQPFLLRKGIQLITSGIEPGSVRDILETYIMAGDYRGKELLVRHMIIEGILMIQAGEHPRIIGIKLTAFLGESYTETVEKSLKFTEADIIRELQVYFEQIKDAPPYSTATALLEDPFNKLDDRSLQRFLRDIEEQDLACAIKGASGKTQLRIFKNLPKMAQLMFKEDLEFGVNITAMINAQNKVLELLQKLKDAGEIA